MMRWSLRLGSLFGIGIHAHVTFLILLAWIALMHVAAGHDAPTLAGGMLLVVSVFAVIVLHELGHALVARRFGIRTRDITLLPFGGLARLERTPDRPSQELVIALAGPAVNLALAGVLFVVLVLMRGALAPEQLVVVGGSFLAKLAWINLSLGVFNLLPAFPMDGGRVLRAALALRMPHARATVLAARTGQGLAILLGLAGLWWSTMLVVIAIFVALGAQQEIMAARVRSAVHDVLVGQAMVARFETLAPADSLATAAARALAGFQHDFPVVEEGRLVGVLTDARLASGLAHSPAASVGEVMERDPVTAAPEERLEDVLPRLAGERRTIVVTRDGRVAGVLTPETVGERVMLETVSHPRG